ncbi:MAG: alpha-glucosidase/alpha-galactosidase [Promethearchaeota archaeon]
MKIAFVGAGSIVFGQNILTDILTHPCLTQDMMICIEDIDPVRLDLMYRLMLKYKELYPKELDHVHFEKTTDLKKAITDTKYIICSIHNGGLDAYKIDMDIPLRFGVTQCVGDTIGPGGVFRFLRATNVLREIVTLMQEVGYNANKDGLKPILFNYANPMAMNTWFCNKIMPDSTVGLCHGVQNTAGLLRRWIGVKQENYTFTCVGINHLAWFLHILYKDIDDPKGEWKNAYPLLYQKYRENPDMIKNERIRWDMMEATGYFMTEESRHLSEYVPYYRKREDLLKKYKTPGDKYGMLTHGFTFELDSALAGRVESSLERKIKQNNLKLKSSPSDEYVSHIIGAMETNQPLKFHGNVINKDGGLITNLPKDCCVEVPSYADYLGIHPQGGFTLPTVCQALCLSNIMVQKAAVEGALELDKEKIYHAVLLDPNTATICSPREIRDMVDDLFEAEKQWLPKF